MLLAAILAVATPMVVTEALLVGRKVEARAGRADWIVPTRLDLVPQDTSGVGPPTRLRIQSLGVDTDLEALRLDSGGSLESPKEFNRAGWFEAGTPPGDPGPAVIAGHVDSRTGPAVFYRLHELKAGDKIDVQRDGAWLTFSVTALERYPKANFPSAKVYGPTPGAELRLITCGGTFDTVHNAYRDNVVVYAVLRTPPYS